MPRSSNIERYLQLLKKYYFENKSLPNFEGLKHLFGLKSKGSVSLIFEKLIDMGYLKKEGNKFFTTDKFTAVQLFESVQAGFPSPGREDSKTELNLQEFLIQNPFSTFLLKVKGDSMKDAGILEGDIIIVDKSKKAKIGEIVVGLIDGEFTLKYYEKDKSGNVCLVPANPNYPILYPSEELQVFGVVCGIVRKYGN